MLDENIFSAMDIDTIGEILNISMGTAATTVSEVLEQKVSITTPKVQILHSSKISIEAYEPAVGVEINYVSGLTGKNIMILKESDIKIIVGLLLRSDDYTQDFVLDEMSIGAICEVMNQMMGSSSTALSQFLNRPINISPPSSFRVDSGEDFRSKYFEKDGTVVMITFRLTIGDLINSEFISLMQPELAKKLASIFNDYADDDLLATPAISAPPAPVEVAPAAVPAAAAAPAAAAPMPVQPAAPAPMGMTGQPPQAGYPYGVTPGYAPGMAPAMPNMAPGYLPMQAGMPAVAYNGAYMPPSQMAPSQMAPSPMASAQMAPTPMAVPMAPNYAVEHASIPSFDMMDSHLNGDQNSNLNMIMSVSLQVSVEIGRTTKMIKEILDFTTGTIVELNKAAGTQVDVYVNGKPIAKGDVVVVDDYYGVRITEVLSNSEIMKIV